MPSVKTAISLPKKLFEEVDKYAEKFNKSRSAVIRTAIENFLNDYQNRKALIKAKKIYKDIDESERKLAEDFLLISSETLGVDDGKKS